MTDDLVRNLREESLAALILQAHSLTPCRITSTPVSV
jgi:hypothetical protein